MSIKAQCWAWGYDLPPMAKFVLVALADQSDEDGAVRYKDTSAEFFSKKCGIGVRTFWRQVSFLEENGYLIRVAGGGHDHYTQFFLQLHRDNEKQKLCANEAVKLSVPVPSTTSSSANDDTTHYSNQYTKESTSAREARSRGKARALARVAAVPALADPLDWVDKGTRQWFTLEAYYAARGDYQTMKFWMPGSGKYAGKTGCYFQRSIKLKALSEAAQRATGPPDDVSADEQATESEPGNADHARESTASL